MYVLHIPVGRKKIGRKDAKTPGAVVSGGGEFGRPLFFIGFSLFIQPYQKLLTHGVSVLQGFSGINKK